MATSSATDSARIGSTLNDFKKQFGAIVGTFGEGLGTEYEFQTDEFSILVVPLHKRVEQIIISSIVPFDDSAVAALLTRFSGNDHWKPHPERTVAVTNEFPGLLADGPRWRFFTTEDGLLYAALYDVFFSSTPYTLCITSKDLQSRLGRNPPVARHSLPALPEPEIHNPFFFYRGRRFEAVIGTRGKYQHSFGAVGGFAVHGQPQDQRGLHQLLTLDTSDPVLAGIFSGLPLLPLFYGFHYESGGVEYRLTDATTIAITKLDATSYDEHWPYAGYPATFPVQPFTLTEPKRCSLKTFGRDVWQDVERRFANHFIAIIPSSDAYHVNLWHDDNNFDDIHIKCFVDPATRQVVVYNECD